MKPHPKIRKTVKWGGAVLTVLLLATFVASWWWKPYCYPLPWQSVSLPPGAVMIYYDRHVPKPLFELRRAILADGRAMTLRGVLRGRLDADARNGLIVVPLLPLIGVTLVTTAAMWRLETLARRCHARAGHCPKCNYNRHGIPAQAVCPECGAAPAAMSNPSATGKDVT